MAREGDELLLSFEVEAKEELNRQLIRRGLLTDAQREELAADLGRALADFLSISWGGQQVYIGKDRSRKRRDAAICAEFTGCNQAELARKYNVSTNTVYRIIKDAQDARRMKQCSLLDI